MSERSHGAPEVDPAAWERRRERLGTILSAMADHAMVQASFRCPYKNRHDECTARFGCRNQRRPRPGGELLMCGGDDKLDYRRLGNRPGPRRRNLNLRPAAWVRLLTTTKYAN